MIKTLTVAVPNYNHARYLLRCLDSILSQSRLPDEILICDDGSSDNSIDLINSVAAKQPMVRLIQNENNQGVLFTIRRLAEEAKSGLFIAVGADDELCPGFIERVMAEAEQHPEVGMFTAEMIERDADPDGTLASEKTYQFANYGVLSPEGFRSAPDFLDAHLSRAMSIATVFRKDVYMEAMSLSVDLGPQSDLLERLYVAAKYGVCLIDQPGQIFHLTQGGFSRRANESFATAKRYMLLTRKIRSGESARYFPEPLLSKLTNIWVQSALDAIEAPVTDAYHLATKRYLELFDELGLPGKQFARLVAKVTGLGRALQRVLLRSLLKKKLDYTGI